MGKAIPIKIINKDKESIRFKNNEITITTNSWSKELKKEYRAKLYKSLAPTLLNAKFEHWQNIMNLKATKLNYRKTKRQWGSCSYKNAISLNTFLVMLPSYLIDYIIVHELSHIVHKNHSKEFWSFVEKFIPEYKKYKKELKLYGAFLN